MVKRRLDRLWGAIVTLSIAILLTLVFKGWPLLNPEVSGRAPLNTECDLREQPCTVSFPAGGQVQLAVSPAGIPAVRPLSLSVRLSELPMPERVEVDFSGVDMEMGFNRVELLRLTDPEPEKWFGQGMLPVCVRDRMVWEARVLLHYPDRLLAAPFRFESARAGAR